MRIEDQRGDLAGMADHRGSQEVLPEGGCIAERSTVQAGVRQQAGHRGQRQTGVALSGSPTGKRRENGEFLALSLVKPFQQTGRLDINETERPAGEQLIKHGRHLPFPPRQQSSRAAIRLNSGRETWMPVPGGWSGCMARRKR